MTVDEIEATKRYLTELNIDIGVKEQEQGNEAIEFFNTLLSDQLIFRRASGKVVGKKGQGFIDSLKEPNSFRWRRSEDISVTLFDDRASVRLVVVGELVADGKTHHYRNIRLFCRKGTGWVLELWYNYEIA